MRTLIEAREAALARAYRSGEFHGSAHDGADGPGAPPRLALRMRVLLCVDLLACFIVA